MSGPPYPSHRNVDEPEPKYCALCGLKVGGIHIQRATALSLRGFPICDVTPGCRRFRHAMEWRDRFQRSRKYPVIGQATNPVYTPGAVNPYGGEEMPSKYLAAGLSINQNTDLDAGDHVQFDTELVTSGHVTVTTGAGQNAGVFVLPQGIWRLTFYGSAQFVNAGGRAMLGWAVANSGPVISGVASEMRPLSAALDQSVSEAAETYFEVPSGSVSVEVRILGVFDLLSITEESSALIEALE